MEVFDLFDFVFVEVFGGLVAVRTDHLVIFGEVFSVFGFTMAVDFDLSGVEFVFVEVFDFLDVYAVEIIHTVRNAQESLKSRVKSRF